MTIAFVALTLLVAFFCVKLPVLVSGINGTFGTNTGGVLTNHSMRNLI